MKNSCIIITILLFTNLVLAQDKWFVKSEDGYDYYLTTKVTDGKLMGMTRENALKDIVGGLKFKLAKMATSLEKPEIIHFEGNMVNNVYEGNFQRVFIQSKFKAIIKSDSLKITIINNDGSKNNILGLKVNDIKPIRNYKNTFEEIFKLTEDNIYNQKFINSSDWKKFKKRMTKLSGKINDDFELQVAFLAFARDFPFSHYNLSKSKPLDMSNNLDTKFSILEEIDESTCVLKIKKFSGTREQMLSFIATIETKKYRNLIIDLRDNPGGDHLSAFPLAEYIIDKPIISGVFPNNNWYKEFDRLPSKNDYSKFTEFSGGSMNEWNEKAANNYGAYFKVLPSKKHFTGKVYVLTNNNTGSTCEPFVYGLKYHKYATIIGEHTAGAMLSSNEFKLSNDLILRIPLNDYITYSGERLDENGVKPNIEIESDKALEYILNKIVE